MKVKWLCALLVIMLAVGCASGTAERNLDNKEHLEIGSVAETTSPANQIICASTQENYKQFMKYVSANDRTGADNMLARGQLFMIETGTEVKVIQATFNGIEVRVQEGPHKDKTAWISLEFLNR